MLGASGIQGREGGAGVDGGIGDNGASGRAAGQAPVMFMEGERWVGKRLSVCNAVMWQERWTLHKKSFRAEFQI